MTNVLFIRATNSRKCELSGRLAYVPNTARVRPESIDNSKLTGNVLRIISPNNELRDFVNEAVDGLIAWGEFGVNKVAPNSEEVVAMALTDPWAEDINKMS